MKNIIGVDIGGTNVKLGVVSQEGKILSQLSIKTDIKRDYKHVFRDISDAASDCVKKANFRMSDISGMGLGIPGTVDNVKGEVIYANNLGWKNVPVRGELLKYFNFPVVMSNDANCAAMGEMLFGSAKGLQNVVLLTLGTGVGAGFIVNGKMIEGNYGAGAEGGHTLLIKGGEECTCGRRGCIEAYVSATALIRDTKRAMLKDKSSVMWRAVNNDIESVSGRTAFECGKKNDITALKVVNNYIENLAEAIISFINIFRPDVVLLGGGVSAEKDYLFKPLQEYADKYIYAAGIVPPVPIKTCSLGNDAGLLGAAALLIEN